ncbi:hypothetical protein OE88DRAFT_1664308 [Heliocybe sulcata]|uniref:Uncharacterized protein n=1 Tax=Heliocybe sulcata TaxID=5364 RepID=A0A5C3MUH1_9AGAM|nr:hypothetical protein OE88DRAFT_1664308 [Heliocybe sulcata]
MNVPSNCSRIVPLRLSSTDPGGWASNGRTPLLPLGSLPSKDWAFLGAHACRSKYVGSRCSIEFGVVTIPASAEHSTNGRRTHGHCQLPPARWARHGFKPSPLAYLATSWVTSSMPLRRGVSGQTAATGHRIRPQVGTGIESASIWSVKYPNATHVPMSQVYAGFECDGLHRIRTRRSLRRDMVISGGFPGLEIMHMDIPSPRAYKRACKPGTFFRRIKPLKISVQGAPVAMYACGWLSPDNSPA